MISYSVALEQAEKEYKRVFPATLNSTETYSGLDYLIEFLNNETLPKILIFFYACFLVKITIFQPFKLILSFCKVMKKKRKYRKKFLDENRKEFSNYEVFDANLPYEPKEKNSILEEKNSLEIENMDEPNVTNMSPKSSIKASTSQEIEISMEKNSYSSETGSKILSFLSSTGGSFHGDTSISNDEIFNKELKDLSNLYANFCAYLEIHHKNAYIPPSRHFLEWLNIKKNADKQIDEIKRKIHSIYEY
jgi:hypothetical protein